MATPGGEARGSGGALQRAETGVDVRLDERKMYVAEWADGAAFGFTVTPVQSDRGTVLCLARRTAPRDSLTSAGLEDVVPGDMLIAIGDEKVYHLGASNATKYLRSVQKPVRLTLQLSPYGSSAKDLPDLAPNEYTYLWESGPLGIVLTTDPKSKLPLVKRLTGKADSPALERDVNVGDELVYVNQTATSEHTIAGIIGIIKELPKPITLRFRKPLAEELQVEVPELGEGEYDFLWEYGSLGLVVGTSPEGLPFVRSFTGKGTSRQLSQVQENDEIILVNHKSAKETGFHEIMQYIMNVPKPAVIRFRRPPSNRNSKTNPPPAKQTESAPPPSAQMAGLSVTSSSPPRPSPLRSSGPGIQWTDGPFGFTVREARSKQGAVILITKRTGKSTCAGLRRVAVGDILVKIGEQDVRYMGFERGTMHLRNAGGGKQEQEEEEEEEAEHIDRRSGIACALSPRREQTRSKRQSGSMADQVPAEFNEKYRMGRVIGEGNFSIVKECTHRATGERFAVKCINKASLNPKDRSNLVQEIDILKDGVTHRDLKPENLLYADESAGAMIKIADFGFAKLVTEETNMSTMCGTPGYYAPEIVRKQPYDSKCDIWSLGVIAYILLCGFPPFYDENQVEEMRKGIDACCACGQILNGDFEFVAPYFDGVSQQAKDLICRMLVVHPNKRLTAQVCQRWCAVFRCEVLDHPWFNDIKEEGDDLPVLSVGKNMKEARRLTSRNKFRAGVGAVMAVTKTQRLLRAARNPS
ncbi:hypothetical protein BBJ28_00016638 [Nothophytophthora sp. Chile5]|nr:hypothetical protein BBJ28_00016638 [Nothophytophthora sp. Chile5]